MELSSKAKSTSRRIKGFVLGLDAVDKSNRVMIKDLEAAVVAHNTDKFQLYSRQAQTCYNVH